MIHNIQPSRFLFFLIISAVICSFLLGAYVLETFGIQYVTQGGNPLFKINLYSYLSLLVFVLFFVAQHKGGFLSLLGELFTPWSLLLGAIIWIILYGFMRFGLSGLAYVVDTLLVPVLIFPVVLSLSLQRKRLLLGLIAFLMLFNALSSVYEYITSAHLWTPLVQEVAYFRSGAWLTHPLNNALIMASLAPILIATRIINPVLIFALTLIALFAFGARSATAVYIIISGFALLYSIRAQYIQDKGFTHLQVGFTLVLVMLAPFVVFFLVDRFDIGARVFENMAIDTSAQTRFDVFYIFEFLSPSEIVFGASTDAFDNIEYFIGNAVVENYVIGWILFYGLVVALPLLICFFYFILKLFLIAPWFAKLSLLTFVLVSLTNNSLVSKTPALLFLFVMLACLISAKNEFLYTHNTK